MSTQNSLITTNVYNFHTFIFVYFLTKAKIKLKENESFTLKQKIKDYAL